MEFLKKNYEKIILSLVLLGLVGVLAFMPVMIFYDQKRMADLRTTYIPSNPKPLPALDMSQEQAVLERLKTPYALDFSTTNKLFNPVQWQRARDGRLVKAAGLGPNAAVVTKITPLYYIIALKSVITSDLSGPRYVFSIEDQAAPLQWQRRVRTHYASTNETVVDKTVGGKNEGFTLLSVKGPPDNPELVLKLAGTQATVAVSKDKPYRRVDAYSADLKYDPDKFTATGLRVGDHVAFAGDDYNVIAIDKSNVILLAQSNQKKYNLPYAP